MLVHLIGKGSLQKKTKKILTNVKIALTPPPPPLSFTKKHFHFYA